MVVKPLCPLYKNIIKSLDRTRYPELRYTITNMGCSDSQFTDKGSVEKHQEAFCILASCYHGTAYA